MRISGVEITSDLDTVFILFSLPRLKQTQLSLICKQASLPPLFTPVLAFPNSFYLCSCAVQEESCQRNIHYYSDKNRVAFTSISQRQLYSLLQSSIKNRRRRANCRLAAESPSCPSLLQVDPVWSRGGNDLWSLFVMGQSGKQTSWCSINTEVIRSGTKEMGMMVFPASSIGGNWILWATWFGGIFPLLDPPGSGFIGYPAKAQTIPALASKY